MQEIKNTAGKNQEYIPLSQAGKILNTSRDYVNVCVRRKKLQAVKLGRNWVTTQEWITEYRNGLNALKFKSLKGSEFKDLEKEEKQELLGLKTKLVFEKGLAEVLERIESKIENISQPQKPKDSDVSKFKSLEVSKYRDFAATHQIPLSPRKLRVDEKNEILETVNKNFKNFDTKDFINASKRSGILKSLSSWSNLKLSFASGLLIIFIFVSLGLFSENFNISLLRQGYEGQAKFQASIFSDIFSAKGGPASGWKTFPSDILPFSNWLKDNALSLFKSQPLSDLAIDSLEPGESKIIKTLPAPQIKTLEEAFSLDSDSEKIVEEVIKESTGISSLPFQTESSSPPTSFISSPSTSLDGTRDKSLRASNLESRLLTIEDQINLNNAELQLQKKTILGTLQIFSM